MYIFVEATLTTTALRNVIVEWIAVRHATGPSSTPAPEHYESITRWTGPCG
jgi:hypothetical protein